MDAKANQIITVSDRRRLTVTAVKSVLAFDDEFLKLDSEAGIVLIEGKELLIENLSKDKGEIWVTGRIDKLEFLEQKKKK